MAVQDEVVGVVLAGGRSRRLGQDKVVLSYEGESLLSRSVTLLRRFCSKVVVSGRDPTAQNMNGRTAGVDAPWLPDVVSGIGPMGGIITGLEQLQKPLLVTACDLPLLNAATVARLLDFRRSRPAHCLMTTFLQQQTGFIESLVAVYEIGALPFLQSAYRDGVFKLSRALPPELRHELPYGAQDARFFFNINHPHELEALLAMEETFGEASCP